MKTRSLLAALRALSAIILLAASRSAFADKEASEWKAAPSPISTRWARDVDPKHPLPEYPRPQMVRREWRNLNGLWNYSLTGSIGTGRISDGRQECLTRQSPTRAAPTSRGTANQGKILVPFPLESALSGVGLVADWLIDRNDRGVLITDESHGLDYRRRFRVPSSWANRITLLHFGAVDWNARAFLNGKQMAFHRGGYDGFTVNLGRLKPGVDNDLLVSVDDATGDGQARGKQWRKPEGIWYTPTTGIWQTVWMEPVNDVSISDLKLVPDIDNCILRCAAHVDGTASDVKVEVVATDGGKVVARGTGAPNGDIDLKIANAKLWSPGHPFLYDLRVRLVRNGKTIDDVTSYFGMRKLSLGKDAKGVTRLMLNGKFVFEVGPLDQGFWPDGIYTAPTDAALRWDIEAEKRLGFNMVRKHVKVEPDRWYYWCDKLGLLVWQDMPSSHEISDKEDPARNLNLARWRAQFEHEMDRLIEGRGNHPCIVMWVVFNEGWGQYDTERIVAHVRKLDTSRLIDDASGWTDKKCGDVIDMHNYPGPGSPKPEENRAAVLGEFGGLGYGVPGHTWSKKTWGYRQFSDTERMTRRYEEMLHRAYDLSKAAGLSACVYTQLTDVETEANGLFTYDRQVMKMPEARIAAANRGHFAAALKVKTLVPAADTQLAMWRFTFDRPPDGWFKPDFDDSAWKEGKSGFGTTGTPGAVIGTVWKTDDIWIRRAVTLPTVDPRTIKLWFHHDEDAEVYINGVLAFTVPGYATEYDEYDLTPAAQHAIKPGVNTIAVHCHQTVGGQYVDLGLVQAQPTPAR